MSKYNFASLTNDALIETIDAVECFAAQHPLTADAVRPWLDAAYAESVTRDLGIVDCETPC